MSNNTGFEVPNHTQTPNSFFDESLRRIPSLAEMKVVLAVIRQTFGWHKYEDEISLSQLQAMTGLTRETVSNGVQRAIEHGYIRRRPYKNSFLYSLVIVGKSDQSENPTSQEIRPKTVGKSDQQMVGDTDPQKKVRKEKKERVARTANAKSDELLSNPHVIAYRHLCNLTPNGEQCNLIASVVTNPDLWNSVLTQFMREGQNPRRVDWLIERYDAANASRPMTGAELDEMMNSQARKHESRTTK